MNEEINQNATPPNGEAHDFIPVLGTEPVKPKAKRRRKKKAAPKVARAPKTPRIDPLRAEEEASQASAINPFVAMSTAPVEDTPTSALLAGVGAVLTEARESRFETHFRENPRPSAAPPIKSTWAQRFVFGLRRMTGFDPVNPNEPPSGISLGTGLFVIASTVAAGVTIGVLRVWF